MAEVKVSQNAMAEGKFKQTDSFQAQVDLPIEIVIHIMDLLPLADRINASQVCRAWYEASHDQKLHKKEIVVLQGNLMRPMEYLMDSISPFVNFFFKEVEINKKLASFWSKFCPQIRCIALDCCIISEKVFVDILSQCHHLERLAISNCRELLMSGRILELESDVFLLKKTLSELKELSITHNRYMSDAIFYRFVSIAPNLRELDLTGCQISYHMGLYKKFYPSVVVDECNIVLSETVLTFNVILRYIREQAEKLKILKLGHTFIDNSALSQLANLPNLNLTILHLQSCDQLTNTGLTELVHLQRSLTTLDLSGCSRLTDHTLIAICHSLNNLKSLNIQSCRAVTDIGVKELARLDRLECLNLAQCEMVTGKGVVAGVCDKCNRQIKQLNISALQVDEESVLKISENLTELQFLDLSWCFNGVTDRSMQALCTNLLHLSTLKLASCNHVSDAGITGSTQSDSEKEILYPEESALSDQNSDAFHRINLRTRAEREIVADARRKRAVLDKCVFSTETQEGISLKRIQSLQYLDMSGCNRITDVGLVYAFHFPGLWYLDLSRCQQVSYHGLAALSKNNPSLQTLIMNNCFNITDEAIVEAVKSLQRLKHLDIQGCSRLSDESLLAMGYYCLHLQYLNVNNCSAMSVRAVLELEKKLPTLLTIHYVGLKSNEISPESSMNFTPPPPPPSPGRKIKFRCFLR